MLNGKYEIERRSTKQDDASKNASEKMLQELREDSKREQVLKPREKPDRLEYDANGEACKYSDRNGDVIEKRSDGWYRTNVMTPDGEKLKDFHVDGDGTVNVTYNVPKDDNDKSKGAADVTKQIRMDGTEVAKYPEGTSTETVRNGDQKTVTVKNESGAVVQTLQYKGMELQQVDASDGTKYLRNADGNGWTKYNADGAVDQSFGTTDKFAVKADANGNVIVRNANLAGVKDGEGGEKYATRYYPDGTLVTTSADKNAPRHFFDPTGAHTEERKFDTYVQEMPDNWQELLRERRQEAAMHPYIINNDPNALGFLYLKTADKGDWDDKQNGGQYQAWGNTAWGVYAAETGLPQDEAIWWNGAVKTYNGKNAGKDWGSPLDWWSKNRNDSTFGQNPADADLIKSGYKLQEKLAEQDAPKEPTVFTRLKQLREFVENCKRYTYGPLPNGVISPVA